MKGSTRTRTPHSCVTPSSNMKPDPTSTGRKSRVKPVPDFSRLHQQWENKMQKGKACTKRPCTMTVDGPRTAPRLHGPRHTKTQQQPDEEFGNVVPETAPSDEAFMQEIRRGSLFTPRQSSVSDRQAIYSDYARHVVSRLTLDAQKPRNGTPGKADKENMPAPSPSPFGGVVGLPQRQSIYRRYVHTGLQLPPPTPVGAGEQARAAAQARGTQSEMKAKRVPRKSPAKSPALRTPKSAKATAAARSARSQRAMRVLQGTTPTGRTPHGAGDEGELAGLCWEEILRPLRITNTPMKKDALATKLFTDSEADTNSPVVKELQALEDMEAELEREIELKHREKLQKYGTPNRTPTQQPADTNGNENGKENRGTPKRQRSISGDDKENITPSKRTRALKDISKDKGSPLQCISPNIMQGVNSPKLGRSPLGNKLTPNGKSTRPFNTNSPLLISIDDKENLSPLQDMPQKVKSPKQVSASVDALNQSLCESVLEMETLQSEAEALQRSSLQDEGNILRQLEEIKRKQEALGALQQQLMAQLRHTQRSAKKQPRSRKRSSMRTPSRGLSPLVEQETLTVEDLEGRNPEQDTVEHTSIAEGEVKGRSPGGVKPSLHVTPEAVSAGDRTPPPVPSTPTSGLTGPGVPQHTTPSLLSPTPVMRGSAQLMGLASMGRPRFAFSPMKPPIQTPLALRSAADAAKVALERCSFGSSPGEVSSASGAELEESSIVSSPELSITSMLKPTPKSTPSPQPSPAMQRLEKSPGSLSLAGNLSPATPRSYASWALRHERKHCSVAEVADRYRDALLDQEVALYTGRVGMKLRAEQPEMIDRCEDPISKLLDEGDDTHFLPIHCPHLDVEYSPVEGSAFAHCTFRHI